MSFSVQAELKEKYLHVTVSGVYSKEAVMDLPGHIWGAAAEHKAEKVLVDVCSVTGFVPSLDRFDFAEALAAQYFDGKKSGQIPTARLVLLGNYPILDPQKFGETVALNRGLTCKATNDFKEALDWLTGDSTAKGIRNGC